MARTYRRDSNGRFAGGGGGSKGKRVGGTGRKGAPRAAGTSAPSGTVPKRSFDRSMGAVFGRGGATKVASAARRSPAKMSKAAPNRAKAAYKAATSKARQAKMMAGGRTSTRGLGKRTDAGAANIRKNVKAAQSAAARVRAMERNRGRRRRR